MHSRPEAWLNISEQSRCPMDATPASELFDHADAEQALNTAKAVLRLLESFDH